GVTTIVSSGDEGAYGCVRVDKNQCRVSVALPASDPLATSVGGTTVFLTADGSYGREAVWGNPVSWGGGGGGLSAIFPRPSWQTGPGVDVSKRNRGVPDVAALGDSNSGWSIISDGKTGTYGGTSAATPLWAAFVA